MRHTCTSALYLASALEQHQSPDKQQGTGTGTTARRATTTKENAIATVASAKRILSPSTTSSPPTPIHATNPLSLPPLLIFTRFISTTRTTITPRRTINHTSFSVQVDTLHYGALPRTTLPPSTNPVTLAFQPSELHDSSETLPSHVHTGTQGIGFLCKHSPPRCSQYCGAPLLGRDRLVSPGG
ncbi:hypothetical protein V496_03544 [Pseudogymnoascus sp. VKM F-4515 (FW-2607)]|nr:hypothetical protein V496_03544 [Pseudogymnoascus sp. VKM F-4515 (FW-2607)]